MRYALGKHADKKTDPMINYFSEQAKLRSNITSTERLSRASLFLIKHQMNLNVLVPFLLSKEVVSTTTTHAFLVGIEKRQMCNSLL